MSRLLPLLNSGPSPLFGLQWFPVRSLPLFPSRSTVSSSCTPVLCESHPFIIFFTPYNFSCHISLQPYKVKFRVSSHSKRLLTPCTTSHRTLNPVISAPPWSLPSVPSSPLSSLSDTGSCSVSQLPSFCLPEVAFPLLEYLLFLPHRHPNGQMCS